MSNNSFSDFRFLIIYNISKCNYFISASFLLTWKLLLIEKEFILMKLLLLLMIKKIIQICFNIVYSYKYN